MSFLPFHEEIVGELVENDGLLVMGRGLGIEKILFSFIRGFSDRRKLVLLLNCSMEEIEFFSDELSLCGDSIPLRVISSDFQAEERVSMYLEGGCVAVTSRILVVDFLRNRVAPHMLAGILVNEAHRVLEGGNDAFAIRLFRQTNKSGFIKGFTSTVEEIGSRNVRDLLEGLCVKHLYLWPRFRLSVVESLRMNSPEVVHMRIPMTKRMKRIHDGLCEVMEICVSDLKRSVDVDLSDLKSHFFYTRAAGKLLRKRLQTIWNDVGPNARMAIRNIDLLGRALVSLLRDDCVSFYQLLEHIVDECGGTVGTSTWIMSDAASKAIENARGRIYKVSRRRKKEERGSISDGVVPVLEHNPKWGVLLNIIKEVEEKNEKIDGPVLVVVRNEKTSSLLRDLLSIGPSEYLTRSARRWLRSRGKSNEEDTVAIWDPTALLDSSSFVGRRNRYPRGDGREDKALSDLLALLGNDNVESGVHVGDTDLSVRTLANFGKFYSPVERKGRIIVCPAMWKFALLEGLQPSYVILYDVEVGFVRKLEVFGNMFPHCLKRVYYFSHEGTSDQRVYDAIVKRETDSFENLIMKKSKLVVCIEESNGGVEHSNDRERRVVVDMREFRCALPRKLHRSGFFVVPVTLEIGDYILSPEVCVERKSVVDLLQSFSSGRLFQQVAKMARSYEKPCLLIDFEGVPFSLHTSREVSSELRISDAISKLSILLLHQPKLGILWARDAQAAADLFYEVKKKYDEPDEKVAASKGVNVTVASETEGLEDVREKAVEILKRLPGVDSKNFMKISENCDSLFDLCVKSEEELCCLIGEKNGKQLYSFLNRKC